MRSLRCKSNYVSIIYRITYHNKLIICYSCFWEFTFNFKISLYIYLRVSEGLVRFLEHSVVTIFTVMTSWYPSLQNMHKPSLKYPKINYNCRQLLIEILTKSNMTPKSSPISCQNWPYSADWLISRGVLDCDFAGYPVTVECRISGSHWIPDIRLLKIIHKVN